jgi:hypothetical protein
MSFTCRFSVAMPGQVELAVADQVRASHAFQGILQQGPVLLIV